MPRFSKFTPSRRQVVKSLAASAIAAPVVLRNYSALAAFPERPVRFVVANTPGGPSDIAARILAAALQDATGKTFIIENKGGAGGNIGMSYAARADADGYTLLFATNAFSVNAGLYNTLPYDPAKDFVAVSEVSSSPNTFAVKSDLGAKTMKEFAAMARANPEKFNVATPPIGTTPQLQAEVLKFRENLQKMPNIVFSGGGDAMQAMLSGTVQLSSGALAPVKPHIASGAVTCLAISSDQRWPELPNVPTMIEAGYPDFVFSTDCALFAPAATPKEAVAWLEKETLAVLNKKDIADKFFKAGALVRPKGGKDLHERAMKEVRVFKEVIEQAKITKL